jgi:poly(3-hydroxybutyrate) depolymerase
MRKIAAILMTCAVCYGVNGIGVRGEEPRAEAGKQIATKLDAQVHVTLKYLVYLPADYDKQDKWPLILFLHGAGERGDKLDAIKRHGPPKLIEHGKQFPVHYCQPAVRQRPLVE